MPRRLGFLVVAALAACAGAATGRAGTVVFASGADLQSINPLLTTHPLAHQVQRYALLTTLVRYDSLLQVEPYLARSWTWSPDSTELVFHLFSGLRWHDGVPTTASDVAWTLDAARDPATGFARQGDLNTIAAVNALDDTTLTLHFTAAQSRIPDVLTDLAILPSHILHGTEHAALRRASWNTTPVGNGPFRFVSHTANRRWVFEANAEFPNELGGAPKISRLVIAVVDEPTTKLAALTTGELDFAGIQPAHASFVARNPLLQVVQYPLLFSYAIVFNTRRPPFDRADVRRAIDLALDRRSIVDGYLFGFGRPMAGPLMSPASERPALPDTTGARALLRGQHLSFELLTVGSGEAALEQLIQSQLGAIGIEVHIRQLELASYLARVQGSAHDFDAAVMGLSGDVSHGEVATLLQLTGMPAAKTVADGWRTIEDSKPATFIYQARGVQGMNRRVHGVAMDARGELATLARWYVAQ